MGINVSTFMPDSSNITRRSILASGLLLAAAPRLRLSGAEVCRLMPEQEVGPYYVADELLRSDIVEGKPGVPLSLRIVVMDAHSCQPVPNVAVDIWHCDASGLYSGFTKQNPMGPGGPPPRFDPQHPGNRPGPPERMGPPPENHPTDALTFCRGIQISDAHGVVNFQTVFPGYYMGRTNHIHFKVRVGGHPDQKTYEAGHTSHIGQVFFPEELAAKMMQQEPYSLHQIHRTTQAEDGVYGDQHGELSIAKMDSSSGLHAELIAAVDPSATPSPARRAGGPPPPPGQ